MRMFRGLALVLLLLCGTAVESRAQLRTTLFATGFSSPLGFVQDPTDSTVQYVVQQNGLILAMCTSCADPGTTTPGAAARVLTAPFLDLTAAVSCCGERGLLGLAFAPDYAASGRFFVNFTNPIGDTVVARFHRSNGNPRVADPSTRFDLHWGGPTGPAYIQQPFANHNGGNLMFGPDGFLYIGLGDGGSGGDPGNRAQNPNEWLGKMLRIDVNVPDADPTGYTVPPGNPFAGGVPIVARPEIWAFGLRNPWRYSFDDPARGGTGALLIGDVGQNAWEELDYEPPNTGGRNYGWRNREGAHVYDPSQPPAYLPLTDPIHEYDHTVGAAIMGGFVYRGTALGVAYRGRYFFADLTGKVWSLAISVDGSGEGHASDLVEHTAAPGGSSTLGFISTFGVDAAGEIYIVSYSGGKVLRVEASQMPPQITWRQMGTGEDIVWLMNGASIVWSQYASTVDDLNWEMKALLDLDGDRKTDFVWRNKATGANAAWLMDGGTLRWAAFLPTLSDVNWEIKGSGDFDGDGRADLVWRHKISGQNVVWLMNGVDVVAGGYLATISDPDWDIVATGDFDGDGRADLLWHHAKTGESVIWLMNGLTIRRAAYLPPVPDLDWRIEGVGDVNGDHTADIIWRHRPTGQSSVWLMNAETVLEAHLQGSLGDLDWEIARVMDLDGDGRADVIWRHKTNGSNIGCVNFSGGAFQSCLAIQPIADPQWHIISR